MPIQGVLRHCYSTVLIINDLVLATYLFHQIKHNLIFKHLFVNEFKRNLLLWIKGHWSCIFPLLFKEVRDQSKRYCNHDNAKANKHRFLQRNKNDAKKV